MLSRIKMAARVNVFFDISIAGTVNLLFLEILVYRTPKDSPCSLSGKAAGRVIIELFNDIVPVTGA